MNSRFMGISKDKPCIKLSRLFIVIVFIMIAATAKNSWAHTAACPCFASCPGVVSSNQLNIRQTITQHISNRFTQHRTWLLNNFFTGQVLPALMLFTEQMSAVAMQQTMVIGKFLDAKHQLETQRLIQELQVQAHKDYQPSEDFCWFGTGVRSLASSEQKGRTNAYMLARRQTARQLGELGMGGAPDGDNDKFARWETYLDLFCDPQDSDWVSNQPTNSGLHALCNPAPSLAQFTNADIDYTRTIDNERTISLLGGFGGFDLTDNVGGAAISFGERAVMALQHNLYGHEIIDRETDKARYKEPQYQKWYMALRTVAAKRSVAENSFNSIVGMKSAGTSNISAGAGPPNTHQFLGAIMVELGVPVAEVNDIIGNSPSYYAQLELLAKKIYQNPDFYANLYDKPANVKRKAVALKAIELMVDRAIYESQIRQEMLTSVLLSARLHEPYKDAEKQLVPR